MRRRRDMETEIDSIGGDPMVGDVWWCQGESLGFADGGKVRPVLIVGIWGQDIRVVPLTTRKPGPNAVAVTHRAGTSWLTEREVVVPPLALLSSLGPWTRYRDWRANHLF